MKRIVTLTALLLLPCAALMAQQSVTHSSFKVISEVQELMEAEQFVAAIAKLEVLVNETRDKPYDYAVANQFLAHSSVMVDDTPRALRALKEALTARDLPEKLKADLQLFYGSLLLGEEQFEQASEMLEAWLAVVPRARPRQLFSVAYARYMSGSLERAEELMKRTLAEAGDNVQESWYQVYYRILFDLGKHNQAESVVLTMITRNPNNELNWRLLASHYLQFDRNSQALTALMLAYLNGLVEKPDDLKQIAALYSYIDVPDKAARLIESWVADKRIDSDTETTTQIANLWLMARERGKAKNAFLQAAAKAPTGELYVTLGGIYFEDEEWREAYGAYNQALDLGGLEEDGRIYLLAGISAFRAGLEDEATVMLRNAAKSPQYKKQAASLIRKINNPD